MQKPLITILQEKYPQLSEKEIKEIFHSSAQIVIGQLELVLQRNIAPAPIVYASVIEALKAPFSISAFNLITSYKLK